MRRMGIGLFVTWIALSCPGCVVALGNKGSVTSGPYKQAVALNGELFIVDVRTGTVAKIDPLRVQQAKPFQGSSSATTITIVEDD